MGDAKEEVASYSGVTLEDEVLRFEVSDGEGEGVGCVCVGEEQQEEGEDNREVEGSHGFDAWLKCD
ncbi:unnamed protein product [Sphenostylis stenocarpa]|uniref:Uncharacterized protein n=1 Tax=Sphenostylis stenocarpa TaxID=92480 RepID=A0AA86T4R2_9FABA|nr:unnamed protein product [Sphenostylis stenocarpa]